LSDTRLRYTVLIEQNEDGGYTVTVPSIPGCISEGSTREEALAEIEEALSGYIEVTRKLGKPIPIEISVPLNTSNAGI
jgi:predicted RNase H-like HicB family nuclease